MQTTPDEQLLVTAETSAEVISWWTLGMIIAGMLLLTLLVVLWVIHRRRDMLREWPEDA